jgi:hypothetical protein
MALFAKGSPPPALKTFKFELGNDTYINLRELSLQELRHFTEGGDKNKDTKNVEFLYNLLSKCILDDDGKPLFDGPDDLKNTFDVGLSTLVAIQKAIMAQSGLNDEKN